MQDRNGRPDPSPASRSGGAGHPNTIWMIVVVSALALFAHKYWQSTSSHAAIAVLHSEAPDGPRSQTITENDCKTAKDRLWVTDPDFTECIAYVVAGAPDSGRASRDTAVIFFNGDVPAAERRDETSPAIRDRAQAWANRFAAAHGVTTVMMGRPGLMGSTGFHQAGGMREDAYVMSRALDLLRDRLGVRRFAMAGQSGGARLIAQLMVLGRNDIDCAAMASGAYDTPGIKGGGTVRTNIWGVPGRRYLVPMHEADNLLTSPGRRSFVIGDVQDQVVHFTGQKAWADKLIALGQHAILIEAQGSGAEHHGLAVAALTAAAACASGLSDSEIRAQVVTAERR